MNELWIDNKHAKVSRMSPSTSFRKTGVRLYRESPENARVQIRNDKWIAGTSLDAKQLRELGTRMIEIAGELDYINQRSNAK